MTPRALAFVLLVGSVVSTVQVPEAGTWPIDPPRVMSAFRLPPEPWDPGHRGVDLAARSGDPVRSMATGIVTFAGLLAGKAVVVVRYPDGRRSTYEPVVAVVTPGQVVSTGTLLGAVAVAGGHCGGAAGCLHVGLRADRAYLDPTILVGRRPAVLKPLHRPTGH